MTKMPFEKSPKLADHPPAILHVVTDQLYEIDVVSFISPQEAQEFTEMHEEAPGHLVVEARTIH